MSFELEVDSNFDVDNMSTRIKAGRYRVLIQAIDMGQATPGTLVVDYEIQSGSVAGQEGRTGKEFLRNSKAAVPRLVMLAIAGKVATEQYFKDCMANHVKPSIDYSQLVGREIVVDIAKSKSSEYMNWTYSGIYSLDSEQGRSVPAPVGGSAGNDALENVAF